MLCDAPCTIFSLALRPTLCFLPLAIVLIPLSKIRPKKKDDHGDRSLSEIVGRFLVGDDSGGFSVTDCIQSFFEKQSFFDIYFTG
jgi:hypothetical protein